MKVSYHELNNSSVIENLELGHKVLLCEFSSKKIMDCEDMSVKTLKYYMSKTDTKFFREIVVNE